MAKLGARVTLTDINFEAVKKIEEEFSAKGYSGKAIKCDVSSLESV